MARLRREVCAISKLTPDSRISRPASTTSFSPFGLKGTSTHPVNLFSRFHVDSPWRTKIRLRVDSARLEEV